MLVWSFIKHITFRSKQNAESDSREREKQKIHNLSFMITIHKTLICAVAYFFKCDMCEFWWCEFYAILVDASTAKFMTWHDD